jgi:hypothetical protein
MLFIIDHYVIINQNKISLIQTYFIKYYQNET